MRAFLAQLLVQAVAVAGMATLGAGHAVAADAEAPPPPLRVLLLSNLPEVVTYQDQGFADFIRETAHVPVTRVEIASVVRESLESALNAPQRPYKVVVELAKISNRAERQQGMSPEAVRSWLQSAADRQDVDAVVVAGQGTTRFERFVKGISFVTKIGLLGIDKMTMVFTMPELQVYAGRSVEACTTLSTVRRTKLNALYTKWADGMANGPSDAVHAQAQATIALELPLAIKDAVDGGVKGLEGCLTRARAGRQSP